MAKSQDARGYRISLLILMFPISDVITKRIKGNPYKLELKKYSKRLKRHTLHKESKKR